MRKAALSTLRSGGPCLRNHNSGKKNPPFHLIIYIGQKGESWGSYFIGILIELEIVACVVVADVLNHAGETLHVVWQKALLHVVAEQVSEQTAEVLMAWV